MNDNNFENPKLVPEPERIMHTPEGFDMEAEQAAEETALLRKQLSEVTPGPEDGWHDFSTTSKLNEKGGPVGGDIKAVSEDPNKE